MRFVGDFARPEGRREWPAKLGQRTLELVAPFLDISSGCWLGTCRQSAHSSERIYLFTGFLSNGLDMTIPPKVFVHYNFLLNFSLLTNIVSTVYGYYSPARDHQGEGVNPPYRPSN